ncbi:MAG: LTA synthase family protein, partial [Tannerella sp.]|nr:LTA synthase family protein [Tannerella sp.]
MNKLSKLPCVEVRNEPLLFFLLFLFKIMWFDYSWCVTSTFRPFSYAEMYVFGILFALLLSAPAVFSRRVFVMWILDVALGLLLVSNLIYFRTYHTAIPLTSYGLAGNMRDFTGSIYGSLRWEDAMFPLSTLSAVIFFCLKKRKKGNLRRLYGRYCALVMIFAVFAGVLLLIKGGFKKAYESLQDSYTHTCGTPLYTVAGSACYDYIRDREVYTPETGRHIENWLARERDRCSRPVEAATGEKPETRMNCIIILAESLESWVLEQTVEGQEIMPCMNRLLGDSTTLYAPHVLSQVRGGRSIDAQLMINTGLLPVGTGVYSLKYPHTFYPSLAKAMKEKYDDAYACTLTADKPMVWNQQVIARSFGYDGLASRNHFIQDEKVGPHYRRQLGDVSLLKQCAEKINRGEAWKEGANLLQIVTYSGHFPFVIPGDLKKVHFSGEMPSRMCDYMTAAHYTDRALGMFVEMIRSAPEYDNTLIVITGDHEGLVDMRKDLCRSDAGRGVVSEEPFTPLIILNVPEAWRDVLRTGEGLDLSAACMRYKKVMGQIDIYPTLLDLLGLTDYDWRGLGRSIFDPAKKGIAVDAHNNVYGDAADVPEDDIRHLSDAWKVSDEMIRYD